MALSQTDEDFAIELGVRLPGLRGDDFPIAHALLVNPGPAERFDFEFDVLVTGQAQALDDSRAGKNLDPMANRKNPFVLRVEFLDQRTQREIVAQVLRRAP